MARHVSVLTRPATISAAILAGLVLACGTGPGPSDGGSASPSAERGDLAVDPAGCPFDGPAAAVGGMVLAESTGGGGPDPDTAGGRARLCLAPPLGDVQVELAGDCNWVADRSVPRSVVGTDGIAMGEKLTIEVRLDPLRVRLLRSSLAGTILGTYGPSPDAAGRFGSITADDGRSGVVAFDALPLGPDNDETPVAMGGAGGPTTIAGVVRWACDAPPKPAVGLAVGRVSLRVDGLPGEVTGPATCRWADVDGAVGVSAVDTWTDALRLPGGDVGVSIALNPWDPAATPYLDLSVSQVRPPHGSSHYSNGRLEPIGVTGDGAAGTLRYRDFPQEAPSTATLDNTSGTATASGIVRWSCDPPIAGAVARPADEPIDRGLSRPGRVTLALDVPAVRADAAAVCFLGAPDAVTVWIERLEATLQVGGETVRLTAGDGVLLSRTGADGSILGEYERTDLFLGQDADRGPYTVDLRGVEFVPTDPRYVPFGGPAGPRALSGTLTVDCRDPNAPPKLADGQTLGRLTWQLVDGRSWTVRAACSWTSDRDPVVWRVESLPADLVTEGRQELRFVALPDPELGVATVNGGGLTYHVVRASVVEAVDVAPDRASGRQTFRDLGLGRVQQAQLKLGGTRGPASISGQVDWTCRPPG